MRRNYSENQKSMVALARVFRELREDMGFSLRKAAQIASISPAHLCKLERGETFHSLGIHVLLRLAETYQVPLASILKMAGFIEESNDYLPPLSQYLRMKFRLPPQAIRDIEIAKTVVETKYAQVLQREYPQNEPKRPQGKFTL